MAKDGPKITRFRGKNTPAKKAASKTPAVPFGNRRNTQQPGERAVSAIGNAVSTAFGGNRTPSKNAPLWPGQPGWKPPAKEPKVNVPKGREFDFSSPGGNPVARQAAAKKATASAGPQYSQIGSALTGTAWRPNQTNAGRGLGSTARTISQTAASSDRLGSALSAPGAPKSAPGAMRSAASGSGRLGAALGTAASRNQLGSTADPHNWAGIAKNLGNAGVQGFQQYQANVGGPGPGGRNAMPSVTLEQYVAARSPSETAPIKRIQRYR